MDYVLPLLTLVVGVVGGSLGTYLVGRKQRSDDQKAERRSISRLLYADLLDALQTLYAERVYPGAFLGEAHSGNRTDLTSKNWSNLRPRFAALLSDVEFDRLEGVQLTLRSAASYPVRTEWAENADQPAAGIVGEYREDYIDDWITELEVTTRDIGGWAGYAESRIAGDVAPPPLEPFSRDIPEGMDVSDLEARIRAFSPRLMPWMVEQLSTEVISACVESPAGSLRPLIAARLAQFGFVDPDDPVQEADDGELLPRGNRAVLNSIWAWVEANCSWQAEP